MEVELELRHDAEVAAAAAQPPQQLRVLGLAGVDEPPVRGDDVGGDQVVAREAELAHRPADAAAEREPGDAGARHEPAGRREAVRLRLVVDVGPDRASADLARRAAGSTWTSRIGERSITIPSSQVEKPAMLWPPPRTAIGRPLLRAKPTAAITSAAPAQRHDEGRPAVLMRAVPDPARLRVAVVARRVRICPRTASRSS